MIGSIFFWSTAHVWKAFPKDQEPVSHLFKNNRDGTFTDVTIKAGLARGGWGQGCCVGDYNNDGWDDLFVSYYGQNVLYRNNGNGTFTDVTEKAGLLQSKTRWNSGCAFLDYDRDGHLDLFVANYIDFDIKTAPLPEAAGCAYKGIQVACGPPGLQGGKNILYHNNGDGTFTDVSQKSGMWDTIGTYALSVAVSDIDGDGWPDIYVANDSTAATFYQNQKDGTFKDVAIESGIAYSPDGKPQAGMGVSIGDFNRDGRFDIVKTNFAGDTDSLYVNLATETSTTTPISPGSASTRDTSAGVSASSTWTTMDGRTSSSATDTSIRRSMEPPLMRHMPSTNISIAICATDNLKRSPHKVVQASPHPPPGADAPSATTTTMASWTWS